MLYNIIPLSQNCAISTITPYGLLFFVLCYVILPVLCCNVDGAEEESRRYRCRDKSLWEELLLLGRNAHTLEKEEEEASRFVFRCWPVAVRSACSALQYLVQLRYKN